jgi:hypothetical protein
MTEKFRARLLEVKITAQLPLWRWQVFAGDKELSSGFEDGQIKASFEGYSAMLIVSVEHMPDDRLTHFYESIRQQVEVDRRNKYQFMGTNVREYADKLRSEMIRRRLMHEAIDWPISRIGLSSSG